MSIAGRETPLIQVVDDDAAMRMLAGAALEQAGFKVIFAENGLEALSAFEREQPDAVLLDVMMPEMGGFETCRALRLNPLGEHTPVLMVTGLDDMESIHRAFEAGATDFVTKPLNWISLGYRVRYMLRAGEALHELHKNRQQLTEAQGMARLGHWEMDLATKTIESSEECRRLLGLDHMAPATDLEAFFASVHPEDREEVRGAIETSLNEKIPFNLNCRILLGEGERILSHQGEVVWDEPGKRSLIRGVLQDITEAKKAEEQIRYLAFFDGLTGLANREMFGDRLENALALAKRKNSLIALLFIDLDRFKQINDTFGHLSGDLLLKAVAALINRSVRASDFVARLAGDEFTVLLTEIEDPEGVSRVAKRILNNMEEPLDLGGQQVQVGMSIGISMYPFDGEDPATLLKNADAAMYQAKANGKSNFQFFEKTLNSSTSDRIALENDLHKALDKGEFRLFYQPQIELSTGRIVGAEALLRWHHATRGTILPEEFTPIAEGCGLIDPITEWVIRTACTQNRAWQVAGLMPVRVAVNLAGAQFCRQRIDEVASRLLGACGLDPRWLEVELTENALMENTEEARGILWRLRELGVSMTIDDFGTGYSSLSYLKSLPLDTLKIAGSFVGGIASNGDDAAISRAIVAMARSLDLNVAAEGVETAGQLSLLDQFGCEKVQGTLISPPLPAEKFVELLAKERIAVDAAPSLVPAPLYDEGSSACAAPE